MTTKQRILALLEENRSRPLSGEQLADTLGVSRAAVWKAVKELQKSGHAIDAGTNKGYTLRTESDVLSAEGVRLYLRDKKPPVVAEACLASTNILAKRLAAEGAPHGALVVANEQTGGRGRRGRAFISPADTGLYLSMVLRSDLPMESAAIVTSAAAVAVCRAFEKVCGKSLQIKWVNDLYYGGKKCCGILTEASADIETGGVDYLVLGIGLNLFLPKGGFPAELAKIAGAVFAEGEAAPRCQIAAEIANEVLDICQNLPCADFMNEYRARNFVTGRDIVILQNGEARPAHANAITDKGHLLVTLPNGQKEELSFGEISIRIPK